MELTHVRVQWPLRAIMILVFHNVLGIYRPFEHLAVCVRPFYAFWHCMFMMLAVLHLNIC
jgi:hypothetical protein